MQSADEDFRPCPVLRVRFVRQASLGGKGSNPSDPTRRTGPIRSPRTRGRRSLRRVCRIAPVLPPYGFFVRLRQEPVSEGRSSSREGQGGGNRSRKRMHRFLDCFLPWYLYPLALSPPSCISHLLGLSRLS